MSNLVATEPNVHHDAQHSPFLAHHFDDMEQQKECATLGMWLFLATEVLLFGAVFTAYIIYRHSFYDAWVIGSDRLKPWAGTLNTVILLTSSFFVVMAVHAAHQGRSKAITWWLILTVVLGLAFLCVKAYEYHADYVEGLIPWLNWHPEGIEDPRMVNQVQLFFIFYFTLTMIHALHMTIGAGILAVVAWMAHKRKFTPEWFTPVDMSGLYWHFVDVVWIFLFPMLYLVNPTAHLHK